MYYYFYDNTGSEDLDDFIFANEEWHESER